jgi:hypothetical protein
MIACTYQSITLQAGESFILPPGAELVSASNLSNITSENDCLDLTNIEEVQCYGVIFGDSNPGGSETPVYATVDIYGLRVDNIDYPFVGTITANSSATAIKSAIDTTTFGPLITNITIQLVDSPDRGNVLYVAFQSIPSITSDMYFYGLGTGEISGDSPGTSASIPVSFKVVPYDEFINSGGTAPYPACSTSS